MTLPPRRLFPHPLLTAMLFVSWLWLNNTLALGHVALAALLAFAIPFFTRRFWPEPIRARHPWRAVQYVVLVSWDILVANVQVAALILGPMSRVRPAFVRIPLELQTDLAVTLLASTITLTPGTVTVGIEDDGKGGRVLIVHALRCLDVPALAASIKHRYERRLREIFEC